MSDLVKAIACQLDPVAWSDTPIEATDAASMLHRVDRSIKIATAVTTAIESAGYRIVPVEPTPEMMQAAADGDPHADVRSEYGYAVAVNTAADLWSAMLAAAPKVTP